jgi:hypothetical protein
MSSERFITLVDKSPPIGRPENIFLKAGYERKLIMTLIYFLNDF